MIVFYCMNCSSGSLLKCEQCCSDLVQVFPLRPPHSHLNMVRPANRRECAVVCDPVPALSHRTEMLPDTLHSAAFIEVSSRCCDQLSHPEMYLHTLFQYSHHPSSPLLHYLIHSFQTTWSLLCLNEMIIDFCQSTFLICSFQMWSTSESAANPKTYLCRLQITQTFLMLLFDMCH